MNRLSVYLSRLALHNIMTLEAYNSVMNLNMDPIIMGKERLCIIISIRGTELASLLLQ